MPPVLLEARLYGLGVWKVLHHMAAWYQALELPHRHKLLLVLVFSWAPRNRIHTATTMIITDHPTPPELRLDYSAVERTPGLHISDIYGAFYRQYQPQRYNKHPKAAKWGVTGIMEPDEDYDQTLVAMGLAWERQVEISLAAAGYQAERPGEFSVEEGQTRIWFSPDLIINNGVTRGGEIKLTQYALPAVPDGYRHEKFEKWMSQMKLYGHKLELSLWTLLALHIRGDYRGIRQPTFKMTNFEFTAKEMADEWSGMMTFARQQRMVR